jgi:pimeloyl-ACP methyl ester carboxylesterase
VVTRPDGRTIAYASWGDPSGRPLLLIHGTPGSRLTRSADPELYTRIGTNVATFDRPGYGQSSVHHERTITSAAADGLAVADELGWDRFAVLGVSGGGPHALALGALAPERIASLGLAVGATPASLIDPNDLIELNREGVRRAQEEGRESLAEFLGEAIAQVGGDLGVLIDAAMADAPPIDRELLAQPAFRQRLLEGLTEAFANGPQGWFDDSWVLSTEWDFVLEDVGVPAHMWYGELDRNVPLRAVRQMADKLDVASFELIPGAGHLGWIGHEERVLKTLLD